ncbi:ferulic acid 5-hydroxylase 1 [Perilla frutescens var. frutescens]|nr:ferulic acid 5-hydroxylase 1 [Perilla frutescens var. frutescens]
MDIITALQNLQLNSNTSLALVSFLLLCIVVSLKQLAPKRRPFPPGPKGLPVIGSMGLVSQLNHRGLAALSKIYGGLFHFKVGKVHMVAVSTAEMAREVLLAQDNVFSNRPASIAVSYLTYDRADMAFAHYGPFWRQMRKICVTKVFSRKRAESWASVREEINSFIKDIDSRVSSPVNIGEMVLGLTKNITYRAAFGSMSQEGQGEFVKIMQEFSQLFGAFNIADFIPWLGWISGQDFNKRLARARGSLDAFIDRIIDDHIKKRDEKNNEIDSVAEDDMVDELMEFYSENGANKDSSSSIAITRDNIKALIMDVMFGGTETVASAIEWAMAELMKSPKDLKKVQQELNEVVGFDRKVHESDLEKLTYLKCVTKETLRLHPPIPLLLHETSTDTMAKGYRIPAKTRVVINVWAIARDKNTWVEPNAFNPARFLKDDAPDFKGSHFEYLPFGSGRRSCPGMQLGLYALELTVAHLCHSFNWQLANQMNPNDLDMNDRLGLTAARANQLVAIPNHRLNVPLF